MKKFLLGKKLYMSQIFNGNKVVPVTLIEAGPCHITQIRTLEKDGYQAVQLGFGKTKSLKKPQKGHLRGLPGLKYLQEFRVSELKIKIDDKEKKLEKDLTLTASWFKPGDKVKISGVSKGKGFAGAVKRWGFAGGPASHGHRHVLRTIGSIGSSFPQRVRKGKKMPGRMGRKQVTVKGLEVVEVEPKNNLIAVKGAVPGNRGTLLKIVSE